MNVTPKYKKLDLGILQHLEQFSGLGLGWVISAYPPTMNITPKNKKLDLGILQHLEKLLGLGLRWVISAYPPTMNIASKNEKLDLGILRHLKQLRVRVGNFQHTTNQACHTCRVRFKHLGLGLSIFHSDG